MLDFTLKAYDAFVRCRSGLGSWRFALVRRLHLCYIRPSSRRKQLSGCEGAGDDQGRAFDRLGIPEGGTEVLKRQHQYESETVYHNTY